MNTSTATDYRDMSDAEIRTAAVQAADRPEGVPAELRAAALGRARGELLYARGAGGVIGIVLDRLSSAEAFFRSLAVADDDPEISEIREGFAQLLPRPARATEPWTTPAAASARTTEAPRAVVASAPSSPIDIDAAQASLDETRAALAAASALVDELQSKREKARGDHEEAKRAYAVSRTPAAWKTCTTAEERTEQLVTQLEIVEAQAARLGAEVAEQESALLEALFEDAKRRARPAAVDALLESGVEIRAQILRQEAQAVPNLQAIALGAAAAQHRAVDDVFSIGARLGIERSRLEALRVQHEPAFAIYQRIDELAREKVAAEGPADAKAAE